VAQGVGPEIKPQGKKKKAHFLSGSLLDTKIIIFLDSVLQPATFSRSSDSFDWRTAFRNQDLDIGCANCYRSVTASWLSQWMQRGSMYFPNLKVQNLQCSQVQNIFEH
jgi:hypothetical protein